MDKVFKKVIALVLVCVIGLEMSGCGIMETGQTGGVNGTDREYVESSGSERETEAAEQREIETAGQDTDLQADGHEMADSAVQNMRIGWNLGNSLDATGSWIMQYTEGNVESFETAWGNPVTPPTLMQKLKSSGFDSVRIPITWNYHFDEEGNIDAKWMARVKEIVDWAMEADLYCIINIHHDTGSDGWLRASKANYDENSQVFKKLWEQISAEFRDYPDLLLFEGFNEMLDENAEWSNPNAEAVEVINWYNQLFVDTVRSTGGNNAERNLICCTYAAATTGSVLDGFRLPEDSVQGHLLAEIHFYLPYEFITDEGVTWTTPLKEYTDYVEQQIDEVFLRLSERFAAENVPLIVGEFACDDKDNTAERIKWYTHVIEKANEINATCFIWDNGNGFSMGHIDRVGDEDSFPQIIEACVETAK
ncbi:MAG: glycoside hydrolase family 5 protein [Acetatifactor sp.]|nr:glycoside hydrolase family 5 protein [Acetatifactor sp.]